MKTLFNVTLLTATFLSTTSYAHEWIETALWKAPQVMNFQLKAESKTDFNDQCDLFRKVVFNADGTLTRTAQDKSRLARFRKSVLPLTLELNLGPWDKIEKRTSVEVKNSEKSELPYFSQSEATTGVLIGDAYEVNAVGGEKSYITITRKLGLDEPEIKLSQNRAGMYQLELSDLDVACDLYEKSGAVEIKAPAYILLSEKGASQLRSFYEEKLFPELKDLIFSKKTPLVKKAVRLGYRTGKILEDEFGHIEKNHSEKLLQEVVETIFDAKTLETSKHVIKMEKDLFLNLETSSEAKDVIVVVEF